MPISAGARCRDDRNYNRPVKIPYGASHETMRRADRLYDYCLVLDWNIFAAPARPRQRHLLPPGTSRLHADAGLRRRHGEGDGEAVALSLRPHRFLQVVR